MGQRFPVLQELEWELCAEMHSARAILMIRSLFSFLRCLPPPPLFFSCFHPQASILFSTSLIPVGIYFHEQGNLSSWGGDLCVLFFAAYRPPEEGECSVGKAAWGCCVREMYAVSKPLKQVLKVALKMGLAQPHMAQ